MDIMQHKEMETDMTLKIIGEPGSGKTKQLMEICAKEKATFVCRKPEAMEVKAHFFKNPNTMEKTYI